MDDVCSCSVVVIEDVEEVDEDTEEVDEDSEEVDVGTSHRSKYIYTYTQIRKRRATYQHLQQCRLPCVYPSKCLVAVIELELTQSRLSSRW